MIDLDWRVVAAIGAAALLFIAWFREWKDRTLSGPSGANSVHLIERIRAYRQRHGVSLREARDAILAEDAGRGAPLPAAGPALDASVEELVRAGNVIGAIKLYREQTGCSLLEAKQAIDRLRQSEIHRGQS